MTTEIKEAQQSIPQRSDIEEVYKWNLTDIYKTEDDWEADYKKVQKLIEEVVSYQGKLSESPDTLFKCLELSTEISKSGSDLFQYAKLSLDLDNRVSKYQALSDRAMMLNSEAAAAAAFIQPELLQIPDDKLRDLASKFPKTDIYDFFIEDLIRSRAHIRSGEVEEVLAMSSMVARGPYNAFTMLDDADIKYPVIKDEQGREVQLTKQRAAKFLIECTDQRVRRDASNGMSSAYKEHINSLGAMLSTAVQGDVFYSKVRKYESALHSSLDGNNIPVSVYHNLLDTTEKNLSSLHKWLELRKKILKLDKAYPYDNLCPLFPEQSYEVDYKDAVNHVLEAVKPLGEKYCSVLNDGFNNRWIDVYETEGKGSGAYSWGNYSTHSFVLMNYNKTINDMFTLAHEMGHAMHSYLSSSTQPFPKAHYATFVAEVASTLNEGLLLDYMLKKTTDDKQKLFLLNRHIDNTFGTFFHQCLYARFELKIHEMVEKGEALSPDIMNEMWENLTKQYYGEDVTIDEYTKYKWSRIPHFYMTFYVYQYATSYAASQAVLDKFLSGEKGIIDKYLKLLSSGGSDYPINQLKICDVDMTTPGPIEATAKLFAKQVDEVEKLTGV
ncbi:MAG: oligoendopeptidase F [candidate division Zixibacteria bacterium]|nr:oligoendopeptidase F [candidate division Zixibacteria bacterium]